MSSARASAIAVLMGSHADSPPVASLAMAGADGVVGEAGEAGASTGAGEAVRVGEGAGEAVGLGTSTGVGAAGVGDNSRNRSSIDLQHI